MGDQVLWGTVTSGSLITLGDVFKKGPHRVSIVGFPIVLCDLKG